MHPPGIGAQPPRLIQVEHHYLLYASAGAMRLEHDGSAWALPPARAALAALVAAGAPLRLLVNQNMSVCSVLFATNFAPAPIASLAVFEMSPLARELILECGREAEREQPLSDYGRNLFRALQTIAWRLAEAPSPATTPIGRSPSVVRALALSQEHLSTRPGSTGPIHKSMGGVFPTVGQPPFARLIHCDPWQSRWRTDTPPQSTPPF